MKHTLFCLLLLCCGEIAAQTDQDFANWLEYTKGEAVVIAPAGLNLRAKPTLQSKVLHSVSFAQKVKIIDSKHFGQDTVGAIALYYSDKLRRVPIDGFWLKVRYQNIEGFMFSAYLDKSVNTTFAGDEELNHDYILLYPGEGCVENYFYHPTWNWYGFYKTESGIIRKTITPSFYNFIKHWAIEGYRNIVVSSNDNKHLQFIIGTREPLSTQSIKPVFFKENIGSPMYGTYAADSTILKPCNLKFGFQNQNAEIQLKIEDEGVEQIIGAADMGLDIGVCEIIWCGDLDGDKKCDYIIMYGDKWAKRILYLSKPAEKGNFVKPVAVYYSSYCC